MINPLQLDFSMDDGITFNDDLGRLCLKVVISGEVVLFEVIGVNPINGWYLLEEIKAQWERL